MKNLCYKTEVETIKEEFILQFTNLIPEKGFVFCPYYVC